MQIIPVLDLLNGEAVHAREGNRDQYRPVKSILCPFSQPGTIIESFLELYPFKTIYLADLNAIQKKGNNNETIQELSRHFKQITFWLDAGNKTINNCVHNNNIITVLGTESGVTPALIEKADKEFILSLDFYNSELKGESSILANTQSWPVDVIVMTMQRIGSDRGPDLELIRNLQAIAPTNRLYAAGGVRDTRDLERIQDLDISGVLIATALHDKKIGPRDLQQFG